MFAALLERRKTDLAASLSRFDVEENECIGNNNIQNIVLVMLLCRDDEVAVEQYCQ